MKSSVVAVALLCGGCTGLVSGSDPPGDAGSDSADAAVMMASDSGVEDAGVDAGTQQVPDAGRTFSTNRADFFGAPRCGSAGVLFCDDFESRTVGGAPDPASWRLEFWNAGAATAHVEAVGARGNQSMRFQIGQGQNKAMMALTRGFPIAGNAFWVRLFLRMEKIPLAFKWNDTANFPLTHWTFAYATGNHVFTGNNTLRPELRAGGYINRVPLMNIDGMDRPEVGIDDANAPASQQEIPENEWICFELFWGGPTQEMRFFQDGLEHPGLHLTTTHTGGTNDSNPPWPMAEPFDTLTLGLVMYQAYDKIGPTIGLNIDEVAVDPERIGCGR